VDRSKLTHLPEGYLFGRVTLYENRPSDEEAIAVLIDGFNQTEMHLE
jgi:hypothetical protein